MAYKYTYPVIDRVLRNFLVLVLVLMVVVGVVATFGESFGIIDLPMIFVEDDYDYEPLTLFV